MIRASGFLVRLVGDRYDGDEGYLDDLPPVLLAWTCPHASTCPHGVHWSLPGSFDPRQDLADVVVYEITDEVAEDGAHLYEPRVYPTQSLDRLAERIGGRASGLRPPSSTPSRRRASATRPTRRSTR